MPPHRRIRRGKFLLPKPAKDIPAGMAPPPKEVWRYSSGPNGGLSFTAPVYVQVTTGRLIRFLARAAREGVAGEPVRTGLTGSSLDYTDYVLMDSLPSAAVIGNGTTGRSRQEKGKAGRRSILRRVLARRDCAGIAGPSQREFKSESIPPDPAWPDGRNLPRLSHTEHGGNGYMRYLTGICEPSAYLLTEITTHPFQVDNLTMSCAGCRITGGLWSAMGNYRA
jgi:hypothetical protein